MIKRDFADDVSILRGYQEFSSEVLRLSLLAIGAVGFMVGQNEGAGIISLSHPVMKALLMLSLGALGLAAAFSLMHRYYSTDSLACHLASERRPESDQRRKHEIRARNWAFKVSSLSIAVAPSCLAVGAALVAIAFIVALAQ